MNHRQNDPSFGQGERGGERRREFERSGRPLRSGGEFHPGDYGHSQSGQRAQEGDFGEFRDQDFGEPFGRGDQPYQAGQGNYQRAAQQQSSGGQYGRNPYAGSGGSTYGASGYGQYSGIGEFGYQGGYGQGERWQQSPQQRDYYGEGRERWDRERGSDFGQGGRGDASRSGYYSPGPQGMTGYGGTQGGYGSSFYGEGDYAGGQRQQRRGLLGRLFKRGPKGYQRSDERLREDISERLMYAMHIDSSEVTVAVAGGKVTLEGTVPERFMKHAMEDLIDECPGVQDIDNRVRVQSQSREWESGTGAQESGTSGATRAGGGASGSAASTRRTS